MLKARTTTGPGEECPQDAYAYPNDLAGFVGESWEDRAGGADGSGHELTGVPKTQVLERLFSTCYQASLLREEERPVTFRAILAAPEDLPEGVGPPGGLHRLAFAEPRPFDERELRRLSPAADFERSLVGVRRAEGGELEIWGIVHTGSRWLRATRGGRRISVPLPSAPVVRVEAPGRLTVSRGSEFVAELSGGRIFGSRTDVSSSRWMGRFFVPVRDELVELHEKSRLEAEARGEAWAPLDPELPRMIARRMYRRLFSTLSEARHGATIVTLPPERSGEVLAGRYVSLKHAFDDGGHRRRFEDLIVGTMNRLARTHGRGPAASYPAAVSWEEYAQSEDRELAEIDEALFEFANLVAGLAAVDGAVVMTDRGELLGFGARSPANSNRSSPSRRPSTRRGRPPCWRARRPSAPATARPIAWRRPCRTPCCSWSPRTATSGSSRAWTARSLAGTRPERVLEGIGVGHLMIPGVVRRVRGRDAGSGRREVPQGSPSSVPGATGKR